VLLLFFAWRIHYGEVSASASGSLSMRHLVDFKCDLHPYWFLKTADAINHSQPQPWDTASRNSATDDYSALKQFGCRSVQQPNIIHNAPVTLIFPDGSDGNQEYYLQPYQPYCLRIYIPPAASDPGPRQNIPKIWSNLAFSYEPLPHTPWDSIRLRMSNGIINLPIDVRPANDHVGTRYEGHLYEAEITVWMAAKDTHCSTQTEVDHRLCASSW
jgi:hypothetical protein